MKTKIFISEDKLMIGTLVLVKNKNTKFFEGYLKYNNIFSNQEIDFVNSPTDSRNINNIANQAQKFCELKNYRLISY